MSNTSNQSKGQNLTKEEQSKGGHNSNKDTDSEKSGSKGHSFTKEEQSKGGKNSHK